MSDARADEILSALDFELSERPWTCETLNDCSRPAAWYLVCRFNCPHDGHRVAVCYVCRDRFEDRDRSQELYCSTCDPVPRRLLISYRWERI